MLRDIPGSWALEMLDAWSGLCCQLLGALEWQTNGARLCVIQALETLFVRGSRGSRLVAMRMVHAREVVPAMLTRTKVLAVH